MASPQKENGYTPIANEILEAFGRIRIAGEAWQVLSILLRKTYGFHKKEDRIALSQLCLATGLKKPTICKALNKLVMMNVITKKDTPEGNIWSINKDFDTWKPLPKKVTLPKKVMRVTQKGNASLPKKPHTKDNYTKDTITKDTLSAQSADEWPPEFLNFWGVYPRKTGKKAASSAWRKLRPSKELAVRIVDSVFAHLQDESWKREDGRFIPHPVTYLNQGRWDDVIIVNKPKVLKF